jgi:hypothetical protein
MSAMTAMADWLQTHAERVCTRCVWYESNNGTLNRCTHSSDMAQTCWWTQNAQRCPHWSVVRTELEPEEEKKL